mmetsp:Transcript_38673/g.111743  ORF Transcript_38673/g.111743 Transcript_38673/m.111743 type:complete len:216 (-) Transcript_38673:817-1464(-)
MRNPEAPLVGRRRPPRRTPRRTAPVAGPRPAAFRATACRTLPCTPSRRSRSLPRAARPTSCRSRRSGDSRLGPPSTLRRTRPRSSAHMSMAARVPTTMLGSILVCMPSCRAALGACRRPRRSRLRAAGARARTSSSWTPTPSTPIEQRATCAQASGRGGGWASRRAARSKTSATRPRTSRSRATAWSCCPSTPPRRTATSGGWSAAARLRRAAAC